MAYTKQTWADLPSKTTPINAERLTHIEDGIFNAAATADNAASAAGTAVSQIGQVSSRVDTLTDRVNGLDTAVSNKVDKVAGKGLSTNDYDNTDKGKVDSLGTASTKNSTSVVTESSDLVESGAVYDALGFGNKNLFNPTVTSHTASKLSVVKNADNSYTVNTSAPTTSNESITVGTFVFKANVKYIMSGCPKGLDSEVYLRASTSNYSIQKIDTGNGVEIEVNADTVMNINIRCGTGNTVPTDTVFYPMIRYADIIDPTYEPYHASVEESKVGWDEAEGYVGKNFYNNTETVMASSLGSVTLNNNGGYTLKGTGQYTSSKNVLKRCEEGKKYILSVKIISSDAPDLRLGIRNSSNVFVESTVIGTNTGTYIVPFTYSNHYYAALTFNFSGTSSEKTVVCEEVMVREEGTPSGYVTFIPSNMELSETKADNTVIGIVEDGTNPTKSYAVDEFMVRDGAFCQVTAPVTTSSTWTEGSNYTKKSIAEVLQSLMS